MPLLFDSNIEILVKNHIRGYVARTGGTVDQLVDYKLCTIEDINIPDGGFGKILKLDSSKMFGHFIPLLKTYLRQEIQFLLHGPSIPRDRKTIVLDMHNAHEHQELHNRYDCAISSNLLEHSPNPISLLLDFYFITKKNGYQFHAIPHYAYTYDRFRNPTPLEHFIEDFENNVGVTDDSHVEDYRQSAVVRDGWQKNFHEKYPLKYPFIHFHVFDANNTKDLLEYIFQDVTVDIYKTDRFSDNVVIFKNALSSRFADKYRKLLKSIGE